MIQAQGAQLAPVLGPGDGMTQRLMGLSRPARRLVAEPKSLNVVARPRVDFEEVPVEGFLKPYHDVGQTLGGGFLIVKVAPRADRHPVHGGAGDGRLKPLESVHAKPFSPAALQRAGGSV